MTKRHKWIPYAVVATGVILVLLLVFAINSEPMVRWFRTGPTAGGQERDLERADPESFTWQDALGTALFSFFILALGASHLALLIVAANLLDKPRAQALKTPAVCPRCDRSIKADWRLCPYCGHTLGRPLDSPPEKRG